MIRTTLFAIALLGLAAAPVSAQEVGDSRLFGDWLVGCDNTRTCRAFGFPSGARAFGFALRLDRDATADALPRLFLTLDGDQGNATRTLYVGSDAGPVVSVTIGRGLVLEDSETGTYRFAEEPDISAILTAIRTSRELTFRIEPPLANDHPLPNVSLNGAPAALAWMDGRQRRTGTVTALAHHGERPASAVPRAPLAPIAPTSRPALGGAVPTTVPRPIMAAFRRLADGACNPSDPDRPEPQFVRLAPRLLLVGIGCWRGAYSQSYAYYIFDEDRPTRARPARFPRMFDDASEGRAARPDHIVVNPDFDAATGVMMHNAKGRGLGDCGERGRWAWTGREFRPIEFDVMLPCRGLLNDWIRMFRTQPPP